MKKRIGNDITFVWHIFRKSGDTQVPESFTGKDVEVKLISPLQRPVTIEDVTIATGVVTFTFRGKHQVTLGNYVAVLQENRGEDGMVTLDVINAVTLVAHSYMEEDGDEGDVIEAESVELTSTISAGGGGGFVQQQADWAQTDVSAVNFILNKPDLGLYLQKEDYDGHGNMSLFSPGNITMTLADEQGSINQLGSFRAGGWSVSSLQGRFQTFGNSIYRGTMGFDHDSVVWERTAAQQIPAATTEANGLMSAEDKGKLDDLPTATELTEELAGKQDTINDLAAIRSGAQAGATAYQQPTTGIPATDLASAVQVSLGKADTALQEHQSLAGLVNTGNYNTVSKKIELKHDNTVLAEIDATAFIKDGMVSSVTISNGYLIITFNTDAGKEPISIALTDIFNPANYYTKTEIDANFPKYDEQGKVRIQTDSNNYTVISAGNISFKNPTWGNFSVNDLASTINSKAGKATTLAGYGITDAKIENGVITLGNNTITPITQHQDITGKADKVSNATNGNFAALDSNGNLIDSGHKHSDYLTQHQDLSNYVQKSQTAGLLKNDGTVDTTQYLTQHQDISGKENVMPITTATGATLSAVVGNYYRLDNVGTLAITLPTITGATKLQAITFLLVCGSSALVTFVPQGSETILYQEDFALEADSTYEVTALWNGSEWTLSRVIYE